MIDLAPAAAVDVVERLLGTPNPRLSSRRTWRFGSHGSLAVEVDGPKAGSWFDFETGIGGDLIALVQRELGISFRAAVDWIETASADRPPIRTAPHKRDECAGVRADDATRVKRALGIWDSAEDASRSVVEQYLANRNLALPTRHVDVLRFHPRCPFGKNGATAPAMIALLRDIRTDEPCGVHRTAILADGSDRNRALGKKMAGRAGGAVVKLNPDEQVELGLGISEGIETGLALIGLGWSPIWAAGSAGAISTFPVLPGIDELTIFGDADGSGAGQRSARDCANRWAAAGVRATIRLPREAGHDWADIGARTS